jgi:excisionase family DNA binding protein
VDKVDRVEKSEVGGTELHSLTTGQAAQICAVTRNAVFKWIQSGFLPARRTRGGHFRIDRRDLDRVMATVKAPGSSPTVSSSFLFCWEYHANGDVPHGCRSCAVYQLRAQRCFELARVAPQVSYPCAFSKGSCSDCSYFQAVHAQEISVLVVTEDESWSSRLQQETDQVQFHLRVAACEYECCRALAQVRPDFILIDTRLGSAATRHLLDHFAEDPQVPDRLLMLGRKQSLPNHCCRKIVGWAKRPLDIGDLNRCIEMLWRKVGKGRRRIARRPRPDSSRTH